MSETERCVHGFVVPSDYQTARAEIERLHVKLTETNRAAWDRVSEAEDQLRGAVEALRELVRLKDGPRDDAYRAAKDAAWDMARDVLRDAGGG
jgi:hypothetical protein